MLRQTKHDVGNIGCNFTFGGDGVRGFKRVKSAEERRKISESKKRLYADPLERKKLGEAIHQAKLDPVKYKTTVMHRKNGILIRTSVSRCIKETRKRNVFNSYRLMVTSS